MQKILIISSDNNILNSPLMQKINSEYQTEFILNPSKIKQVDSIILQSKPQLILVDEFVPLNIIRHIVKKYSFIPVCAIGKFEKEDKLEKILKLGITIIRQPFDENEFILNVKNMLWSSLAQVELWEKEYEISKREIKKERVFFLFKYFALFFFFVIIIFTSSKVYNYVSVNKELYEVVDLKYINPSDIVIFEDKYIINDWSIKNLFEYSQKDDVIVGMLVPEGKFNAIAIEEKNKYLFASSAFDKNLYVFKYPNFENLVSSSELIRDAGIISLFVDSKQNLFVLDNKKILYKFDVSNIEKILLISSYTINDFFPIDVIAFENYLFFLDNENKIYKIRENNGNLETEGIIILSLYFPKSLNQFSSFAIGEEYLYLLNEKEHKVYKLPKKILL
jgi:hypothetical protein